MFENKGWAGMRPPERILHENGGHQNLNPPAFFRVARRNQLC
jgi:hypothetical protein